MTAATKSVIYARYSTDRQDARSIDDQLRRCRAYAAEQSHLVVKEYKDAAQSGASLDRADMQRMLNAARTRGGAPFQCVLVDDLARLSRDLGDTFNIVFGELLAAKVHVIDCSTKLASNAPNARLMYGAMALVNDTFLQIVKTETHRGLEGRALAGFHTGGRCYGYTTRLEESPPDPEHPRAVAEVNPVEARIIVRIFTEYVAGRSLGAIAHSLNAEGISAPYDTHGYTKPAGHGWARNQIHSMLRNERYIGKIVWNQREFFRDPLTKKRRSRKRPEKEWVVRIDESLRIISDELWATAQARHGSRTAGGKRGRPRDTARTPHLLSGLLKCGACGSSMSIVGSNKGKYGNFGCSAQHSKGSCICGNRSTVAEKLTNETVLAALVEYAESGAFEQWIQKAIDAEERASRGGEKPAELAVAETEVRTEQANVEKVGRALIATPESEFLAKQLRSAEERLRRARQKLEAAAKSHAPTPRAKIDVAQIVAAFRDVAALRAVPQFVAARDAPQIVEPPERSCLVGGTPGGHVRSP
ncbi:MAG TPA: recombinase family protein [Anaeromyxobacteraceae bacterium]|nr:recombinase family protein [Anaeromyxobacteraceae bacterium]